MAEQKTIYPKHLIYIKGIKMNLGNDINFTFDMDETFYNGSFNLPDTSKIKPNYNNELSEEKNLSNKEKILKEINNLRYRDSLRIYYGEFSTIEEANNASFDSEKMSLIIDGYIADVSANENRSDVISRDIIFKSNMGLAYENSMQYDIPMVRCAETVLNGLNQCLLIPEDFDSDKYFSKEVAGEKDEKVSYRYVYDFSANEDTELKTDALISKVIFDEFTHSKYFVVKGNSTTEFGECLDTIKKNHSIKVFQHPDGTLSVTTPTYFYQERGEALQFDLKTNIQEVSFGGLNNLYNAVLVHGSGCNGFAFDPISYELALPQEVKVEKSFFDIDENVNVLAADATKLPLKNSFSPDPKYLKIKHIFKRNILDPFSAYTTAVNELYNISKSATVSFNTLYNPKIRPGMFFQIKNSTYLKNLAMEGNISLVEAQNIADEQLWIIKRVEGTISKNDITCKVVAYRNAIADFPAEWITPSDGLSILDLNLLDSISKSKNNVVLH